jgi:peptidoglycan/LPS O-acetylase OafA/YrhL
VHAQKHANSITLLGSATVWASARLFRDIYTLPACVLGFPLLSLGFALLVVAAVSPDGLLARIRFPGTTWIATISYSIYLSHKAVLKLAYTHLPAPLAHHGLLTFASCLAAAIAVAATLHYLVERPFFRLRDRAASRNAAIAAAT